MISDGTNRQDRPKPTAAPAAPTGKPADNPPSGGPKVSAGEDAKAGKRAVAAETSQPGFSLN